jgi:hypothetical protein
MNNTALTAFIESFGNRVFCINLDNTRFIYVGYNGGVKMDDISLETIGGVDYVAVSRTDNSSGVEIPYKIYHLTDSIQWIGIVEEGFEEYGIDPIKLR